MGRGSTLVTSEVKTLVTSSVQSAGLFETPGAVTTNTYVASPVAARATAN